jgi:hypothetical protein
MISSSGLTKRMDHRLLEVVDRNHLVGPAVGSRRHRNRMQRVVGNLAAVAAGILDLEEVRPGIHLVVGFLLVNKHSISD